MIWTGSSRKISLTTRLVNIHQRPARLVFATREETTLCCTEEAGVDLIVLSSVYFGKPADIGTNIEQIIY